jgi:hypothetical protein
VADAPAGDVSANPTEQPSTGSGNSGESAGSGSSIEGGSTDTSGIFADWKSQAQPILQHIGEEAMEAFSQAAALVIKAMEKADHDRLDALEANQKAYYQVLQQNAAAYAASLEALRARA